MKDAIKVGEVTYTRGDVVKFIRFNQRITEDLGMEFEIGNSLFEALRVILEGELAYQVAPKYGITVSSDEVDRRIEVLMGFISQENSNTKEYKTNVEESYRQFLNKTGLSDDEYKEYIKRTIFREKLRNLVARDMSRIQPHTELYEIIFESPDVSVINTIERKLTMGTSIENIALEYSEDKEVLRTKGNVGWMPKGVDEKIDRLIYFNEGKESQPISNTLITTPYKKSEENVFAFYYINDFSEAREIEVKYFEQLADTEFENFINSFSEEYNLWMDINSDIYNWINTKVLLASNSEFLDLETEEAEQNVYQPTSQ
tara:strand:- start:1054 stop:1998 length:945 start_codon:yes stop_codon:yes gene_type:complete